MKRRSLAFICAVAAAGCLVAGCAKNNAEIDQDTVDPTETVVSIGEESQNLAEFRALFDNYLPYMTYYGQDPLESEASLISFQDWLTDTVSEKLVTLYQAKLNGFALTDEQEEELSSRTESALASAYEELMSFAGQEGDDDPDGSVKIEFESIVNSESEYYTGTAMSWDDYKAYFTRQTRNNYMIDAYREHVCEEFVPTDDDVTGWYDSAHKTDKENYTGSPEKYKTDEEKYELAFGADDDAYPVTYAPNGYSRIMTITVRPEGELPNDHKAKLDRLDELKARYTELAFDDAFHGSDAHAAELAEMIAEYRIVKAAADEEYSAYVASAKEKIESAYAELEQGTPFAEVMLRYTEDEAVTGGETGEGCEAFRTVGRLISLDYECADDWSDTVKAEFGKLKCGEYSDIFMDDGVFLVIYYSCDEKSGDVPIEKLYEDIKKVCAISVQDRQWSALLAEWKKDPDLYVNEALIRTVGTDKLKKED